MLKIGHRGACGYEMENTEISIRKAFDLHVHMIEVDVRITSDNRFVIFHDKTLDRCTNASGNVADFTWEDLKASVKYKDGSDLLSLEEAAEIIKEINIPCIFELKESNIAHDVYNILNHHLDFDQFIIGSFFHRQIIDLNNKSKLAKSCFMQEGHTDNLTEYLKTSKVDYLVYGFDSISSSIINQVHKAGCQIFVYTLNDESIIKSAIELGVDGIISNYPDRVVT